MFELAHQTAQILLWPTLLAIDVLFAYALVEAGRFAVQNVQRRRARADWQRFVDTGGRGDIPTRGYPVAALFASDTGLRLHQAEVFALKRLEAVRVVTRVTPMLGLVATLIPMGPALIALSENNVYAMGEHMRTAFTAVILGLATSVITFWIASVRKRWYAEEIVALEPLIARTGNTPARATSEEQHPHREAA